MKSVGGIVPPLAKNPQPGRINVIVKHRQEDQVVNPSMLKCSLLTHKDVPSPLQLVAVALERSGERSSNPLVGLPVDNLLAQEMGQGRCRSSASRLQRCDGMRLIISKE
jgi:hypothetical protein